MTVDVSLLRRKVLLQCGIVSQSLDTIDLAISTKGSRDKKNASCAKGVKKSNVAADVAQGDTVTRSRELVMKRRGALASGINGRSICSSSS